MTAPVGTGVTPRIFSAKTIGFLHSQTYDIQIETVKQAHIQGVKTQEVPILFVNRKQGKSKLNLREIENYVSYIFKTVTQPVNWLLVACLGEPLRIMFVKVRQYVSASRLLRQ